MKLLKDVISSYLFSFLFCQVTQQRKSKRKVKPLKKLRKTDDKETKLEERSTIIPTELLRRSARLKRETKQGHS